MVRKTKFSFALIGETRKKESFFKKCSANKALTTWQIPVSCKNRQTENLGNFDGFQPSGMRSLQILRFAEIVVQTSTIICFHPFSSNHRIIQQKIDQIYIQNTIVIVPGFADVVPDNDLGK